MSTRKAFEDALFANQTSAFHDQLKTFGQFIGSWDIQAAFYDDDGAIELETTAEWHFSWILGGRAIQDVLIFPARTANEAWNGRMGTTVRVFDQEESVWRIVWVSPADASLFRLTGKQEDSQIVLHGDPGQGEETIWRFYDVTDSSFTWVGLVKDDGGKTWRTIQVMKCERR